MSLLQQDSTELDDAARGEELTRGSSHVVIAAIISFVVISAAIAIYIVAGQKPPAITGEIEQVWAHPMHSESSGFDASGAPEPKEVLDQIMVFAQVKLHNQSKAPLFLHQIMANANLNDGILSVYAASATQYNELFIIHPELAAVHGRPLSSDTTIDPGQTVEGTIVSAFRLTKPQWDARKDLNFTFAIRYQPQLVLTPKAAVTELP
jgi:hypothetical protein